MLLVFGALGHVVWLLISQAFMESKEKGWKALALTESFIIGSYLFARVQERFGGR